MRDDLPTEGSAAAQPDDYVRRFMEQLADPATVLRTDQHDHGAVWSTTMWGDAGKAAILDVLRKSFRA